MMYNYPGCWTLHMYCTYGDYLSLSFPPFLCLYIPSETGRQILCTAIPRHNQVW